MSNYKGNIGQSAVSDVSQGSKEKSGCNSASCAWVVQASGALNINNNKNNNLCVRPFGRCSAATFPVVYDIPFSSIIEAWIDCERNKRTANSCTKFRWQAARRLYDLWVSIVSGNYKPSPSMCFIVTAPVKREIFAAAFVDRVVHHYIGLRLYPLLEKWFIESGNASYNCRKGYGTFAAVAKMERMLYDFTDRYTEDCWIVGGNFCNFFMSLDKDLLIEMVGIFINERYTGVDKSTLLYLLNITIDNCPQDNCFKRSPDDAWTGLPPRKSLFHTPRNKGIAIGNLPSQLLANFVGSVFDHWVIYVKGHTNFIRFVDDYRIFIKSQKDARSLVPEIRNFLKEQLLVELHPKKTTLQHYAKGCKITGAIIKPGRIYISNRTIGRFINRLNELQRNYYKKATELSFCSKELWAILEHVRASVNSYLGLMAHYRSYKIRRRLMLEMFLPVWGKWFYCENEFAVVKIRLKYNHRTHIKKRIKDHRFAAKYIRPNWQEE